MLQHDDPVLFQTKYYEQTGTKAFIFSEITLETNRVEIFYYTNKIIIKENVSLYSLRHL